MHALIRDTLAYIHQEFEASAKIAVSAEEALFFQEKLKPIVQQPRQELPRFIPPTRQAPRPAAPSVDEKKAEPPQPLRQEPSPQLVPRPAADPMNDLRALIASSAPAFRLKDQIPSDAPAKKIAGLWQEELHTMAAAVLAFGQTGAELEFLHNVAKAVNSLLVPAKLIDASRFEKENKWDLFLQSAGLKCVIAPPFESWKGSKLSAFYRENPAAGSFSLQNAPLLLLQPVKLYLKNPDMKKGLWTSLVSQLSS